MALANKKSHKSTKPLKNAAGRVDKQPPAKAKSAVATSSSSRQSARPAKGTGSSKTTQKPAQRPEAAVGKSGSKRKAAESIQGEDEEHSAVAKMPMLKPKIRSIPPGVVTSKWAPMSEKARGEVYDVIKSVERPVLMTFEKENQKTRAQEVLRELVQRLVPLLQVPVPPMGRDMVFSYERLIDKNRELESILEPDLRQIAEIEAEIEREQKRLKKDENYYIKLNHNADFQEKIRRQQARSVHPLLKKTAETTGSIRDGVDDIGLSSATLPAIASSYDVSSDRQILPLTKALQQHLSSMQGNNGPLEELAEWIQKSRSAVDEVIFERVGEKVYDGIMGL